MDFFHFYDNRGVFIIVMIYYIYKEFFHGIFSPTLAGNLQYFIFDHFYIRKVLQFLTSSRTTFIMPYQYKYLQIIATNI